MKPSHAANDNDNGNLKEDLLGYGRQVWQSRLGRDLSREDVRQITDNLTGFFQLLAKWSRAEGPTAANDNDAGLTSDLSVNEEQPTVEGDLEVGSD